MTLAQLRKIATAQGLKITKDRHYFVISESYKDDTFVCRVSVTKLQSVETQLNFYAANQRFTNTKIKRNVKTGEIIWKAIDNFIASKIA